MAGNLKNYTYIKPPESLRWEQRPANIQDREGNHEQPGLARNNSISPGQLDRRARPSVEWPATG